MEMKKILSSLVMVMVTVLFLSEGVKGTEVKATIGVILDDKSRVGKEAKVGIEMALDDFKNGRNQSFVVQLQVRYSQSKPWVAALAARDLIDKHQVNVILGLHSWGEVSSVAEIASEAEIPILSLADSAPQQATNQWPFLIQASPSSQDLQMKAVAAIIKSHRLAHEKITFIYENIDSTSSEITHYLNDALHEETGEKLTHTIALSPFSSLSQHLEKLKRDDCKVFVVHSSLYMGVNLFKIAKKMGMMKKKNGYVWIVTNTIMDHLDSVDSSIISSMQGVLGIKSYFLDFLDSDKPKFQDFKKKFRRRFIDEYPDEESYNPGIFALQAYDATTAAMLALIECSKSFTAHQLLDEITNVHFNGLSGEIQFVEGKLAMRRSVFELTNVIGNGNTAFWTYGNGFSDSIGDEARSYSPSLGDLENVLLPRRQLATAPTNSVPLKVLVPLGSLFEQFVIVKTDKQTNQTIYDGFCIEVFKATMDSLNVSYEFSSFPADGSYDELIQQIPLAGFDAVAGDVTILASRSQFADFTQPYTESGLEMIVPIQSRMPNKAWLFLKPFTKTMWIAILGITIYNGLIIWLIERNHNDKLREGTILYQIGTLIWLSFTTLFSLHGGKLHSNFSRMSMVVWLFVALIITQSYTASLTSMLTTISLEPTVKDIETLKRNNATVGYCKGSFVRTYLEGVLGFDHKNVRNYSEPELYAGALKRGELAAVFLEVPSAKLFLAQNCKSFVRAGETYKVGGFGFAFPKGYPSLQLINEALLNVSESGKLKELEDKYIVSEKCVDVESGYDQIDSLSLNSFWILFAATVGTSSIALVVYTIKNWCKPQETKSQEAKSQRSSSRVSHAESPRDTPKASNHWADV